MNNRPLNSRGEKLADPVTWNVYDRGYRTGAQTSLFIGPIWVEEVVSVQINTQTSDVPVYPYSTPYYGRLLLGNYQMTGQIGITYTEPDYLLRIIELAQTSSIQDEELQNIIEGRKSIFLNTVKYKLLTEKVLSQGEIDLSDSLLTEYAVNYVERITREIETSSFNQKGSLNPHSFEMTLITGSLYNDNQAIEIFEDVKIIGTGKMIANDDSSAIEVYQFIGRKKPDRKQRNTTSKDSYLFSKPNLMKLTYQVAEKLIDTLINPPDISVFSSEARTAEMLTTDRIAPAGLLPSNPRMYGKQASFCEIVYAIEYPAHISTYNSPDKTEHDIISDDTVQLIRERDRIPVEVDAQLTVPLLKKNGTLTEEKGFDNRFGRMISPDREQVSTHIAAVAPIKPIETKFKRGGSIALPRYEQKEFGIGSYYPPKIVDLTSFEYSEHNLSTITAGTLWCSTLGFRSTTAKHRNKDNTTTTEEMMDNRITEITQPLNTLGIIHEIKGEWEEAQDTFTITISAPRAVDFCNLSNASGGGKRAKMDMKAGKTGNYINMIYAKEGNSFGDNIKDDIVFEGPLRDEHTAEATKANKTGTPTNSIPAANWAVYEGSRFSLYYTSHDAPPASPENPTELTPHYFEVSLQITQPDLSATMNKCIYCTPFVFLDNDTVTVTVDPDDPESYSAAHTPETLPSGTPTVDSYFASATPKKTSERLAYYLSTRNNVDDSCTIHIAYDSVVANQSGYFDTNGSITIHGVYFLKTKQNLNAVTADDGSLQDRSTFGHPRKVHVFWLATVMPILHLPPGIPDTESDVDVIHSIEGMCGRYVEIYNITRCDAMMHNASMLVNLNAGVLTAVKNALVTLFSTIFPSINSPTTSYTFPFKAMWERFAGFLTGYSFRIDVPAIVSQLLKCTFTADMNSLTNRVMYPEKDGTTWTLGKALKITIMGQTESNSIFNPSSENATALSESIPDSLFAEIDSMVRCIIDEKLKERGGHIVKRDTGKGMLICDVDVITPARTIVAYGLTKDGLEELHAMTAHTEQTDTSATTGITLTGYQEADL